jgi:hypothetical protein
VDTYIPSSRLLQRTLYTWSQLSDYTTMHCWDLPASATSSTSSSSPSSLSFSNDSGRLCSDADVVRCPGHPWVNYSYHMQVKQWQESRDPDQHAAQTAAAAHSAPHTPQPYPNAAAATDVDGLQRREAGWLGAMAGKVPEVRVLSPAEVFSGRRRGLSGEERDDDDGLGDESSSAASSDLDGSDQDWDDVCTTEPDDDALTDCDMGDMGDM